MLICARGLKVDSMDQFVASGNRNSLGNLASYESYYKEGDTGKLSINCLTSYGLGTARDALSAALKKAGVNMPAPVKTSGRKVIITFKKAFPFLAIILAVILASIIYIMIQNWELVKQVAPVVADFFGRILPYLPYIVVGTAGLILVTKGKKLLT